MIQVVMAVRDAKSELFGRPVFYISVGVGVRAFDEEINAEENNSVMSRYPDDFGLYTIGTYDDKTGTFVNEVPKLIITGAECKRMKMNTLKEVERA